MNLILIIGLLVVNTFISWYNAKVCGEHWSESKALGGFARVLMWCGAIQSAIGFSMILLLAEMGIAIATGSLPQKAVEAAASLWYLAVIIPALGTGLIITVHSWIIAIRERSWQNMGAAAWNTFATGHNVYSAANGGVSDALSKVGDLFDGDDKDGVIAKLVILLVAIALAGGGLLTALLIRKYDRRALAELRQAA